MKTRANRYHIANATGDVGTPTVWIHRSGSNRTVSTRHGSGLPRTESAETTSSRDHGRPQTAGEPGDGYRLLRHLLGEAGLRTCRIEANPDGRGWTVFAIQSTDKGAWQTFRLSVGHARLRRAGTDLKARRLLVTHMANALALREVGN